MSAVEVGHDRARRRFEGLDLARALAMLGMLVEHTLQYPTLQLREGALWSVYGRSAPLFVLLAGAGLGLATRAPRRPRVGAQTAVRAVLLLLVGMALSTQVDGVILQSFALFFLVGLCVLRLPRSALGALAAAGLVGGPLLLTQLRRSGEISSFGTQTDVGFQALADPFELVRGLVLDYYPAVIWLGFFFAGMLLTRFAFRSPTASRRLFLGGALTATVMYVVGWSGARAYGPEPVDFALAPQPPTNWAEHWTTYGFSEAVGWTLSSTALALAIIGAASWLVATPSPLTRAAAPLVALGQMSLSFYLLHFLYLDTIWLSVEPRLTNDLASLSASVAFVVIFGLIAQQWLRRLSRGPVEMVLHAVSATVVRGRSRGRPAPPAPTDYSVASARARS